MIPVFLLYKGLGLTNSFWVYIIPGMVSAFNMLVLRTYMEGIPESLEESAQLDGAGYMTHLCQDHLPAVPAGLRHGRPVRGGRAVELLVRRHAVQPQ